MNTRISPIGPVGVPTSPSTTTVQQELRAVKAQVEVLGGANNYAAQTAVQKRQDAENRKKTGHLIDRKIVTATLAALEPVGVTHDEDEADAERESHAFGMEWPFDHPRPKPKPAKVITPKKK